jgi:putative transposase
VLDEADATGRLDHVEHLWVDGAYRGPFEEDVRAVFGITVEVGARPPGSRGFVAQAKRWAVERSFGWLGRSRRLAKDYEEQVETSVAWIYAAFARLLLARLVHA